MQTEEHVSMCCYVAIVLDLLHWLCYCCACASVNYWILDGKMEAEFMLYTTQATPQSKLLVKSACHSTRCKCWVAVSSTQCSASNTDLCLFGNGSLCDGWSVLMVAVPVSAVWAYQCVSKYSRITMGIPLQLDSSVCPFLTNTNIIWSCHCCSYYSATGFLHTDH